MSRFHSMLCSAALAALAPLAACSSDGRVAFNGGGGSLGGQPNGPPSSEQPPTSPPPSDGPSAGPVETVLASAGNLIEDINPGDNDIIDQAGDAASPLARVSVDGEQIGGQGPTAVGLSVSSETQPEGQIATLGLLNNGQVIAANNVGPASSGDLIGAEVDGDQVIGDGPAQQIGLGVLSPANTEGSLVTANVLTNGEVLNVDAPALTEGASLDGLNETLEGVLGDDVLGGVLGDN